MFINIIWIINFNKSQITYYIKTKLKITFLIINMDLIIVYPSSKIK